MKNILLIGLGAVGTCLASKFVDNGIDFACLCDEQRKKRYEKDHFIINEKSYQFNYVTADDYGKKADFVIVVTKYHSLKDAIKHLNQIIHKDSIVLSLLNGIDSEDIIGECIGIEKMLYGHIYGTDATKVNNSCVFKGKEIIAYGEKSGEITERVKAVKKVFDSASISCQPEDDIITSLWWKYMLNIGINQTSCILKAPYHVFVNDTNTWEVAKSAMQECIAIAKAKKIMLDDNSIDRVYQVLKGLSPQGKTSMFQDVVAKRKTEVEMFSKKLCEMGEALGVKTPVNRTLLHQILAIEYMYQDRG